MAACPNLIVGGGVGGHKYMVDTYINEVMLWFVVGWSDGGKFWVPPQMGIPLFVLLAELFLYS